MASPLWPGFWGRRCGLGFGTGAVACFLGQALWPGFWARRCGLLFLGQALWHGFGGRRCGLVSGAGAVAWFLGQALRRNAEMVTSRSIRNY